MSREQLARFELAYRLGLTCSEMDTVTAEELTEWQALFELALRD